MENPVQSSNGRLALQIMTVVNLLFFSWFWMLFLPVNVLGKLLIIPYLLTQILPDVVALIIFFLLGAAIFVGGVYLMTRLYHLAARKILQRSIPAFAVFAAISILLWILLWPVPCDTHESFLDVSNKKCNCAGWTFDFYPPMVMDGASTEFCVGWESPVGEGQ